MIILKDDWPYVHWPGEKFVFVWVARESTTDPYYSLKARWPDFMTVCYLSCHRPSTYSST